MLYFADQPDVNADFHFNFILGKAKHQTCGLKIPTVFHSSVSVTVLSYFAFLHEPLPLLLIEKVEIKTRAFV